MAVTPHILPQPPMHPHFFKLKPHFPPLEKTCTPSQYQHVATYVVVILQIVVVRNFCIFFYKWKGLMITYVG